MKLIWNFLGGKGVQNKNLPLGEKVYRYFLKIHIQINGQQNNELYYMYLPWKTGLAVQLQLFLLKHASQGQECCVPAYI